MGFDFPIDDWRTYVVVVLVATVGSLVMKGRFFSKGDEPMTSALRDVRDALKANADTVARVDRDVHDTLGAVRKCNEQTDVVLRKLDQLSDYTVTISKQLVELNAILTMIVRRLNGEKR